jgi:hypothetical protein
MAIVIMGKPFLIALLQITLCKKGSNFVAGALRVPQQFVWPGARFEQRHWFARQGFGSADGHKQRITTPAAATVASSRYQDTAIQWPAGLALRENCRSRLART